MTHRIVIGSFTVDERFDRAAPMPHLDNDDLDDEGCTIAPLACP